MKKSIIVAIIIIYLIIGIIIPFVLNCKVFNKSACSSISVDGWASFLGSYIGGVLGGLGTLIAMYMTSNKQWICKLIIKRILIGVRFEI